MVAPRRAPNSTAYKRMTDTICAPGYHDGTDLSGGQWQRIALARALYAAARGARVLVLDEPTAQLDIRAEAAFYNRFLELTSGLTTMVISHRFATVRRAERIAVLEAGRKALRAAHVAALWEAAGWILYAAGFGGAIVSLVLRAAHGHASPGAVVEVVSLLRRAQRQVTGASTSAGSFAIASTTADRLLWLEDYVAGFRRGAGQPAPADLADGIRLEHVGFTYPGQDSPALTDVSLTLRAGSTVAVVGENGAGKSTLIKLLTGMYRPTEGQVTIDGRHLVEGNGRAAAGDLVEGNGRARPDDLMDGNGRANGSSWTPCSAPISAGGRALSGGQWAAAGPGPRPDAGPAAAHRARRADRQPGRPE